MRSSNQSVISDSSLSPFGEFGKYTFGLIIPPTTPPTQLSITVTATSLTGGGSTSEAFIVTITP
jgi:hypothetical protein